jgi:hypothetical protein
VGRKRAILAVLLAGPAGVMGGVQACGPSVQSVYEGNVRFEHCYRLDLDRNIAASHRQACWQSYVQSYKYGQTKDRIDYAGRRARALAAGDTSRPVLKLENPDGGEPISPSEAPLPTSIHAPPPPMAPKPAVKSADAGADGGGAPDASAPQARCSASCWEAWSRCGGPSCDADAGGKVGQACQSCDRDYRRCMQRCFR